VRIEASYAPSRVISAIELRILDTYLISQRLIVPFGPPADLVSIRLDYEESR
jgi:hypothetical protein